MAHSGTNFLEFTPGRHSKQINFTEVDLSVPAVKQFDLPPNILFVGGDSHGSYMVRLWRYITVGKITVSHNDQLEFIRICHNLIQLNPSVEILNFLLNEYEQITVGDYKTLLQNLKLMSTYIPEFSEYYNTLKGPLAEIAKAKNNQKLSEFIREDGFTNIIEGLRDLIIDTIADLKYTVCEDLDTYRELLKRIKVNPANSDEFDIEEYDIGDDEADRVGCDLHNKLLTKTLHDGGLKRKFGDSNHGRVALFALRHVKRLQTLTKQDFFEPLNEDECLGLPVGSFVATFLNMLRFICMGKVTFSEVNDLYRNYYLPHINIIKVVRDKENDKISILTHAPNTRNAELEHVEFLELLEFFHVPYPDFDDLKSVEDAAKEINRKFIVWFDDDKNLDDIIKFFNDDDHVLHRIVWNRFTEEDKEAMLEKLNNNEPIMPDNQEDSFGHDSGIQEIPTPLRPTKHSLDDDGGKAGFNKGTVRMLFIRMSATPKAKTTSTDKEAIIEEIKENIERCSPAKSLMRKPRQAEDFSHLRSPKSPAGFFPSSQGEKPLLAREPLRTIKFDLDLDDLDKASSKATVDTASTPSVRLGHAAGDQ